MRVVRVVLLPSALPRQYLVIPIDVMVMVMDDYDQMVVEHCLEHMVLVVDGGVGVAWKVVGHPVVVLHA